MPLEKQELLNAPRNKSGEWLSDQEALSIEPGLYSINEVLEAVSENYRPSINQAISLIAPKEAVDKIQFKPLLGGLTKSKVFRVDIENKKYVLRLLDENQPPERRRSELNAHKIGAGMQNSSRDHIRRSNTTCYPHGIY